MKRFRNLSIVTMLALAAIPAAAGSLAGVSLPDTAEVGGQKLVLNGMGLRKKLFIKVYVAGFYLTEKQHDAAAILATDTARRGVMHFVFGVGGEKICNEGWKEGLEANTANPSTELRAKFDTLCTYMEDMEDGDSMSFDYLPGTGTTVTVKGKTQGVISGKDFSDALFGCWIGPRPGPGEDFKKALLGA